MNKPSYNIQNRNICNGIFHISFFKALLINEGETSRGEQDSGAVTAFPPGAPEFFSILRGVPVVYSLVFCVVVLFGRQFSIYVVPFASLVLLYPIIFPSNFSYIDMSLLYLAVNKSFMTV
jgi:hypothetical protein